MNLFLQNLSILQLRPREMVVSETETRAPTSEVQETETRAPTSEVQEAGTGAAAGGVQRAELAGSSICEVRTDAHSIPIYNKSLQNLL
jgi:hypothetical protein